MASYSRRIRKSTGILWRSASSSRKRTKRSSAPFTTVPIPSFFSSEEKYGEKKNNWSSRFSDRASVNSSSSSWIRSSTPCSFAASNSARA